MQLVNAVGLASELGLSRGRISQMVSGGLLDGCFSGDGRARRFDISKCKAQLGRSLDPGQMLGNGAKTKKRLATGGNGTKPIARNGDSAPEVEPSPYEIARTQKLQEEARRIQRQNALEEGKYLLADEVRRQVARQIAQEIAEFEASLRSGARRISDEHGIDFKTVRKQLIDAWRTHRETRTAALETVADAAEMTETENEANI